MNIFVTSPDPKIAASHLDDKRVNKMIIETVQMLSVHLGGPYKPTHINHPCTKWVGKNTANLNWTIEYLLCLAHEYTKRTSKTHLSWKKFCEHVRVPATELPSDDFMSGKIPDEFCNCTPYKDCDDVFIAYQMTLNDKWDSDKRTPTWYGEGR